MQLSVLVRLGGWATQAEITNVSSCSFVEQDVAGVDVTVDPLQVLVQVSQAPRDVQQESHAGRVVEYGGDLVGRRGSCALQPFL